MARKLIKEIESSRVIENPARRLVAGLETALEAARVLEHSPRQNDDAVFPRGLTIKTAHEYSGLTIWDIRESIRTGKLVATLRGKHWLILREDLDQYLSKIRDEGLRQRRKIR